MKSRIWLRIGILTLCVSAYPILWQPFRAWLTTIAIVPQLHQVRSETSPIRIWHDGGKNVYLIRTDLKGTWERNAEIRSERKPVGLEKTSKNNFLWHGFGGVYMLLGMVYLIVMGRPFRQLVPLFLLQQIITVISLMFLLGALVWHPGLLYPMNLVVIFVYPSATMGYLLVWREKS